jgi:hypothetical protein
MTRFNRQALAAAIGMALAAFHSVAQAQPFAWTTVVNNGYQVPACGTVPVGRVFNSYSQPSVNEQGIVVFRGRSKGSDGGGGEEPTTLAEAPTGESGPPARGVYVRDMRLGTGVSVVACVTGIVPQPNSEQAPFNEFPAFPRIDASSPTVATRGQSRPVLEYQIGVDEDGLPLTTKVGTSGVYTNPGGVLVTGASLLGAVIEYGASALTYPQYAVPGLPAGTPPTRFDQFPGAPTVTAGTVIGFKGNFTVGLDGKTGVFFRDVSKPANPTYLVANSFTRIPNQASGTNVLFGSTAPPSISGQYMFFVGLDNEDAPTMGGIYRAKMKDKESQKLEPLVAIGTQVPGESSGVGLSRIGEGLSVSADGNFVSFWGAWGAETFTKRLYCPADGNADLIAYCNATFPLGYYDVAIPVHQGIFVYDVKKKAIAAVAKTGANGFEDFLYWVYSGAPPGVGGGQEEGEEDESREPPRWRSSAFAAVSLTDKKAAAVAFKATQGDGIGSTRADGVPGIFLRKGTSSVVTVAKMLAPGQSIDPLAPAGSIITAIGLERDGFRGANLAITASMLYETIEESLGWAGIYLTNVPLSD